MNSRLIIITLSFFITWFLYSCSDSDSLVSIKQNVAKKNLIVNPSFELRGQPSLDGWNWTNYDSAAILFSNHTSQAGGNYAIVLFPIWMYDNRIYQKLDLSKGKHNYTFSVFAKNSKYFLGYSFVEFYSKGRIVYNIRQYIRNSIWTKYEIPLKLEVSEGDSLLVGLSGGQTQAITDSTYFDFVEFYELD